MTKRHSLSWNEVTRRAIDQRLAVPRTPRSLSAQEFAVLEALVDRITPQPKHRPPVPVAALVDQKLTADRHDGYRAPGLPRQLEAWKRGLAALEAQARAAHGLSFPDLPAQMQDALLRKMQAGDLHHELWQGMPPATFFVQRVLNDLVSAYWSHPTAWSEMGWGGPASPRGYVRMGYDERDPWEAAEVRDGNEEEARRRNSRVG
ncbi:MAG TPA: gluconate 2-dehydrogenase subunit 3 family protein [Steroidobacteraceae bacterium]